MYKKLAIFLGALLIAAIGSLVTVYIFSNRKNRGVKYDYDSLFI